MTALTHITAGRTAIRALLIAVVLTAGIAGAIGTAAAEPMDGKGNDPFPPAQYSLDGKGNDVATNEFPINNVTILATQTGITEQVSSTLRPLSDVLPASDPASAVLVLSQDMDPY